MRKAAEVAARALRVRLQVVEARGPADFDRAFSDMTRARAGALAVLGSAIFNSERRRLVNLSARHRLPTAVHGEGFCRCWRPYDLWTEPCRFVRRAGVYVDKILKGAKPSELPVEQPTKFEMVINLKTAKALGLTIPPSLLQRADQVIE
jgi:putative tryptophan/tyrosine transport system substrate-binding protein